MREVQQRKTQTKISDFFKAGPSPAEKRLVQSLRPAVCLRLRPPPLIYIILISRVSDLESGSP
ncbi:Hypothetical protein FKW44_024480 [Caligus rogercresseyi]|uniref:Uncharacterized protein n=1 Tax=Caligus rogercresseyi TaxID=217165 RepID=A0A7T8GM50_CALRO|nr:Hypothetical protein FKW44_024480 [Caligus rogercresseyi]